MSSNETLKNEVKNFWNTTTCGTWASDEEKYSKKYYDDIEEDRYSISPEIFALAQFTRHRGEKVLEIGIGAGSDFTQWVRVGAKAYGIDLTPAAVEHVTKRLALYGLQAEDIRVDDCENLSFEDDYFDVVYSFGVIHHSPNTEKAISEIVRVLKPGGKAKLMIYHRHSLLVYFFWIKHSLLKFKLKSFKWVLWHKMESLGTKAYTKKEVHKILSQYNLKDVKVHSNLTYYDKLERFNSKFMARVAKVAAWLLGGDRAGWFLNIEFTKK